MRRAVVCAVVAFFAVMLQLTFVDSLALPGGAVPDLVLVLVIALGLTHGPATGMLAGFFGGLDLDLAPPASHLIGVSALMFCLLGYGCGRLTGGHGRPAAWLFAVAVLAAAIGETLQATVVGIIGDPGVTLSAVRQVLPTAVLYDALLTPAVLVLVTFVGSARPRRVRIPAATFRSGSAKRGGTPLGHRDRPIRLHLGASRRNGRALRSGGFR
jgi:rod shape-determining protein MreD